MIHEMSAYLHVGGAATPEEVQRRYAALMAGDR